MKAEPKEVEKLKEKQAYGCRNKALLLITKGKKGDDERADMISSLRSGCWKLGLANCLALAGVLDLGGGLSPIPNFTASASA